MVIKEVKTRLCEHQVQFADTDEKCSESTGQSGIAAEPMAAGMNTDELCAEVSEIARIDEALFPANVWGYDSYMKSAEAEYDYLIAACVSECGTRNDALRGTEGVVTPDAAALECMVSKQRALRSVAGFALLRCFDDAELIRIAVSTGFRRRGIGFKLLKALVDEAEERGIHDIILEVRASNEPAKAMYEKAGFITEGIRKGYYSEPKEDAVIMRYRW